MQRLLFQFQRNCPLVCQVRMLSSVTNGCCSLCEAIVHSTQMKLMFLSSSAIDHSDTFAMSVVSQDVNGARRALSRNPEKVPIILWCMYYVQLMSCKLL